MKTALIFPRVPGMVIIPPLGLCYLAAVLIKNGFEADIFHCGLEGTSPGNLAEKLRDGNYQIVGIQSYTFFHDAAESLASFIKDTYRPLAVVSGGPHASGCREKTLGKNSPFDFGFCGEAEGGFLEFVRQMAAGKLSPQAIPGLIWREGGNVFSNPIEVVSDLDTLPMPPWKKINPAGYPHQAHGVFPPDFPVAPIHFSRGCGHNCAFCASRSISGDGIRYRSAAGVVKEMEYLYHELNIKNFAFLDQNMTSNENAVYELCDRISSSGMSVKWHCPSGVCLDLLTDRMLASMKAAGCVALTVGIESASAKTLKAMCRKTPDSISERIALVRKNRINITGNFIFGLPGEGPGDFARTIAQSVRLPLDRAQFAFLVPFPGTRVFEQDYTGFNGSEIDWQLFDVTLPAFVKSTSKFNAWIIMVAAYAVFYGRPSRLFRNLSDVKSFQHLLFIMSRVKNISLSIFRWRRLEAKRKNRIQA